MTRFGWRFSAFVLLVTAFAACSNGIPSEPAPEDCAPGARCVQEDPDPADASQAPPDDASQPPGRGDVVGERDASSQDSQDEDIPSLDDVEGEPEDAAPDDVQEDAAPPEPDATEPDTAEPDADEPDEPTLRAQITSPAPSTNYEVPEAVVLSATVQDLEFAPADLSVRWISDNDGVLWEGSPDANGVAETTITTLSPNGHRITLEARNPDGDVVYDTVNILVCQWSEVEGFNDNVLDSGWETFGDASWDPGGWLEMTGNLMGRKGAIFNVQDIVAPGDVALRFKIWTGGGTGADGFAISIFDVPSAQDLRDLVNSAGSGGALGYGVGGNWGNWQGDAFHIEFDTWYNQLNNTERHTDPTRENHIGVMLNGDPGTHHLWAEIPTIEDQQWHDIEVRIQGATVTIELDGTTIINGEIEGLTFKGGYLGFSGTTGFYTNFHRFDDLQTLQSCGAR